MGRADVSATVTPLLETGLRAPRRRIGLIDRPRLTNRLVRGERAALTLVWAPAGFGETTLLTERAASGEDGRSTARLALDQRDNDPARFVSYLVAALRTVAPEVGAGALALLGSSPTGLEAIVAALLNLGL